MLNRLKPVEKNSKYDIGALLTQIEKEKSFKIMRATTLKSNVRSGGDSPDADWADLPDPMGQKNIKLSKKQRAIEDSLKKELIKRWDEIFNYAVEKKRRKIMLTKDEYSIDYDVVNRRELMLPPEYYLNLKLLEKNYLVKHKSNELSYYVSTLRMYLSRRYDIKGNLIHLTNISHFLNIPLVDLVRRRYKPLKDKLLIRVKKRLKLK